MNSDSGPSGFCFHFLWQKKRLQSIQKVKSRANSADFEKALSLLSLFIFLAFNFATNSLDLMPLVVRKYPEAPS